MGATGPQGPRGDAGRDGVTGAQGLQGPPGIPGSSTSELVLSGVGLVAGQASPGVTGAFQIASLEMEATLAGSQLLLGRIRRHVRVSECTGSASFRCADHDLVIVDAASPVYVDLVLSAGESPDNTLSVMVVEGSAPARVRFLGSGAGVPFVQVAAGETAGFVASPVHGLLRVS
jgi:hypothetical protein